MGSHAAQGGRGAGPRRPVVAVGIDLVELAEIEDTLTRFGERYLLHVFTAHERRQFVRSEEGRRRIRQLAACFAVKEAVKKILVPGTDETLDWQTIEVQRHGRDGVAVELSGTAVELAARRGIVGVSGSVACERRHALAVVAGHGAGSISLARGTNGGAVNT